MYMQFEAEDENCPACDSDDVVYFDKDECSAFKRCFTCESCGQEWSEWSDK